MRAVLVFPPPSSPTYVPLGLASLAAYLRRGGSARDVRILDLNLRAWELAASSSREGAELLEFARGRRGDFFDPEQYLRASAEWARLQASVDRLLEDARTFLAEGAVRGATPPVLDGLAEASLAGDPELVGISCFSLDQVILGTALAAAIRERARGGLGRGPRIVLGGAATSHVYAEDLLSACPAVDAVVVGEGELAAEALLSGAPDDAVPGLVRRTGGGTAANRSPPTLSLRDLPAPDFSGLDPRLRLNPSPVLPVVYSRGCPWRKCSFCAHNLGFAGYRRRPVESFVDELEALVAGGSRHIYLADQYVEASDLELISREILLRRLDVAWHVMGRPTEGYTAERLRLLFEAGCRWISWGVETGSPRLLDLIAKGTDASIVRSVLGDAARAGISNLLMMIFGLPTSTDEDLRATFELLEDVAESTGALTSSHFVLWERTRFARSPERYGLRVLGPGTLFRVGDARVRERRLDFREAGYDGEDRPPRGPHEAARWAERRRWLGGPSFLEGLPTEHYLLHAARRAEERRVPPSRPWTPTPRAA